MVDSRGRTKADNINLGLDESEYRPAAHPFASVKGPQVDKGPASQSRYLISPNRLDRPSRLLHFISI